jgi:hypothetical protein
LCPSLATTIIGFLSNAHSVDDGIAFIGIPKLPVTHLSLVLDLVIFGLNIPYDVQRFGKN